VILKSYKQKLIESLSDLYDKREAEQIANRLFDERFGLSRAELVLQADRELDKQELADLDNILSQLTKGKPLDYILGKSLFFGYEFEVNEEVLIPRPETEELVQLILERETKTDYSLLDIGTGSGCIPIALKLEGKYEKVAACEVSSTALEMAKRNAELLKADVDCFLMDILTEVPKDKYDVVVSNPPYVFVEELDSLEKHVVEYEPRIALSPLGEPLLFYKRILSILPQIIKNGGRLYFEIHEEMGEEVEVLMRHHGLQSVEIIEDMYGRDRFVFGIYAP